MVSVWLLQIFGETTARIAVAAPFYCDTICHTVYIIYILYVLPILRICILFFRVYGSEFLFYFFVFGLWNGGFN